MSLKKYLALLNRDNLRTVVRVVRPDLLPIVVAALAFAVLGALAGKATTSTTSAALVMVTPVPIRDNFDPAKSEAPNQLARMLARPLDVKTATMLCTSDAVLSETRKALGENKEFTESIQTLAELEGSLKYEITVAKETPYETLYSPIVKLTARSNSPSNARIKVNTWAAQCVKAGGAFQSASQRPAVEAFGKQVDAARAELQKAEDAYEAFLKTNSMVYLNARMTSYADVMKVLDQARGVAVQAAYGSKAKADKLAESDKAEPPKIPLDWTASPDLLNGLIGRVAKAPAPAEVKAPDQQPQQPALKVEQINQASVDIRTELAKELAMSAGGFAELEKLDEFLNRYRDELAKTQEQAGLAQVLDKRLSRNVDVREAAYKDAALNEEYARMAASLNYQQMQLLSEGAEWRMPRFRRAILLGALAGLWGFAVAVAVSAALRMALPALKR